MFLPTNYGWVQKPHACGTIESETPMLSGESDGPSIPLSMAAGPTPQIGPAGGPGGPSIPPFPSGGPDEVPGEPAPDSSSPTLAASEGGGYQSPPPAPDKLPFWKEFKTKTLLKMAALPLILIVGFCASRGSTSASSIKPGDCFEIPSDSFSSVDDQSCSGPHEAEAVAKIEAADETAAFTTCVEELSELVGDPDMLPADWDISILSEVDDTDYVCVLTSASGALDQSYVNP